MSRKQPKPKIVPKLRQVERADRQGESVAETIRYLGVNEVTYYCWRREYGGLKGDQVLWMRDLEVENQRLRKAIADLALDKPILQVRGSEPLRENSYWLYRQLLARRHQ